MALHRRWAAQLWFLLASLAVTASSFAQATVKGSLSTLSAELGEDVRYTLEIGGGSPDRLPAFPRIDGVQATFAGRNAQTVYERGQWKHNVSYIYMLSPERLGEFRFPPIEVIVDGVRFQTEEQTLTVSPQAQLPANTNIAFGTLKLARTTAYIGEDIQAELRFYFDTSYRWGFGGSTMPQMNGDGFAARAPLKGDETYVEIGDKRYLRMVFRSVLTPSRAGKLTIGPLSLRASYSKVMGGPNALFRGVSGSKEMVVIAPALEWTALPLPSEGRPKDFSGAIGSFKFNATGTPDKVKAGEPVVMNLNISGQGNFDRIMAPTIIDPDGWRSYPPTDRVTENDKMGIMGTKTFEIAVVPEVKKEKMPVFQFSYFDSTKKAYVTLASEEIPLTVEGVTPPAPPAAPKGTATTSPAPAKVQDILGIRTVPGFWGLGWNPSPAIWAALMFSPAPLIAIGLIARKRMADPMRQRRAELLRQREEHMARVRRTTDRAELFDSAAHLLQLDVALADGQLPGAVDEQAILARLDTPSLRKIFAARAELIYAGGGSGSATASERDEVLDALEKFGRQAK